MKVLVQLPYSLVFPYCTLNKTYRPVLAKYYLKEKIL